MENESRDGIKSHAILLPGLEKRVVDFFEENFRQGYELISAVDRPEYVTQLDSRDTIDVVVIPHTFNSWLPELEEHFKDNKYVVVTGPYLDTKEFPAEEFKPFLTSSEKIHRESKRMELHFLPNQVLDSDRDDLLNDVRKGINRFVLLKALDKITAGNILVSYEGQTPRLEEALQEFEKMVHTGISVQRELGDSNGKEYTIRLAIKEGATLDYDGRTFTLNPDDLRNIVKALTPRTSERILYIGNDRRVAEKLKKIYGEVKTVATFYDAEEEFMTHLPNVIFHSVADAVELVFPPGYAELLRTQNPKLRYVPILHSEADKRAREAALYSMCFGSDTIVRPSDDLEHFVAELRHADETQARAKERLGELESKYQGKPDESLDAVTDVDSKYELARREFFSTNPRNKLNDVRKGAERLVQLIQSRPGDRSALDFYRALIDSLDDETRFLLHENALSTVQRLGYEFRKDFLVTKILPKLEELQLVSREYPWRMAVRSFSAGDEMLFIKQGEKHDTLRYMHHHNYFERLHDAWGFECPVSNIVSVIKKPGIIMEIEKKGSTDVQKHVDQLKRDKEKAREIGDIVNQCLKQIAVTTALGPREGKKDSNMSLFEQTEPLEAFLIERYESRMNALRQVLERYNAGVDVYDALVQSHIELQKPTLELPQGYFCDWVPSNVGKTLANTEKDLYKIDFASVRRGFPFLSDLATFFELGTFDLNPDLAKKYVNRFVQYHNSAATRFNSMFGLSTQKITPDEDRKQDYALAEVERDIGKVRDFQRRGVQSFPGLEAPLNDIIAYSDRFYFFNKNLLEAVRRDLEGGRSLRQLYEIYQRNLDALDYISLVTFFTDNLTHKPRVDDSTRTINRTYVPQFLNLVRSRAEYSVLSYTKSLVDKDERKYLDDHPEKLQERVGMIVQQLDMARRCTNYYRELAPNSDAKKATGTHSWALGRLKGAFERVYEKVQE